MARMLVVPYKKPSDVNMADPVKKFIQQTYTTNLDDYMKSADSLQALRNEALFKTSGKEKLNKMLRYHDQLVAIDAKIPINEMQVRVPFKWTDAFEKGIFGRGSLTLSSNLYERLCVLFNIGACASELAASTGFDSEDSLKSAVKNYQLAAGAFTAVRDSSLTTTRNDCTFDLYPDTLNFLISLMLAQAQELFYIKAVREKMQDKNISKIASQCSEFYADALRTLGNDSLRDIQRQFTPSIAGKQALMHAMAEYHKGISAGAEHEIGEEIARLQKSLELLKVAEQRGGRELNVKAQIAQVQNAFDKADKENKFVYLARVPEYKTLSPIEKFQLAKPQPIKMPLSEDFRDLFFSMVPVAVNRGLAMFKSKKLEAFNLEIGKLRQATELLNTALATWNLPASIEDIAGSNSLPQSIIDKSQTIKDRGGISKIDSMINELPPLLNRNREILDETKRALEEEERSDNDLRSQMGSKWNRTSSKQLNEGLFGEIRQYEQIIQNAVNANKIIEDKYKKHRDGVNLLSKSQHEIYTSLPAASPVAALQGTVVVKDLRRLMDEVEGLKNVREVLESEMKTMDSDAIQAKLISSLQTSSGLDEHTIIQQELDSIVEPMRKQVRENIQQQEKLLGYIEKANSDFNREKGQNETGKLRDEMLKNLAAASDGYNELYNHLQEGIKFYNELTPILIKFQTKVNDFVLARKIDRDDLMREIQTRASRPTSASDAAAPARPPPPQQTTTTSTNNTSSAPYPSSYNPYTTQMPSVYYPFSMTPTDGSNVPPTYPSTYPGSAPYPPYYPPSNR